MSQALTQVDYEIHASYTSRARVLVANSPRAYREAISTVLTTLRPEVEVFTSEPEELDGEVLRLTPRLVVCSRLTETVQSSAGAWVELYPDGAAHANLGLGGGWRKRLPGLDLCEILGILDGLCREPSPVGGWSTRV